MRICILWQLLPKFFLPRFPESLVRTKGCRVVAATAKALDSTENCWTSPNVARFAPWQTGSTNQVHGLLFDSQYQLFLACVKSYKAPTTSTAVRSLAPHDVFSNQFMKLSFLCDNLTSWLQPGDWKLESCKNATSNARCLLKYLKFTDLRRFFFGSQKIRKIVVSRTWLSWLRRPARTRHNLCENFQIQQQQTSNINQISIKTLSWQPLWPLCGNGSSLNEHTCDAKWAFFSFWHYIRLKKRQHTAKRLRRKKKPNRTLVKRVFPIQTWLLGQSNYVENVHDTFQAVSTSSSFVTDCKASSPKRSWTTVVETWNSLI